MNPLVVILLVLALVAFVNRPRPHGVRTLITSMSAGKVNVGSWLLRLLEWDGLLPVGIAILATAVDLAFPKNRTVIAATAVAAFCIRGLMGLRQIFSNNCDEEVRGFQSSMPIVGLFTLLCVDAGIIVSHMDNLEPVFATTTDRFMAAAIVCIYLTSMLIAMYPGPIPDDVEGAQ